MKIERATQLLFLLLISQGGNAAYANLPRGASASSVQVSAQANKITVSGQDRKEIEELEKQIEEQFKLLGI